MATPPPQNVHAQGGHIESLATAPFPNSTFRHLLLSLPAYEHPHRLLPRGTTQALSLWLSSKSYQVCSKWSSACMIKEPTRCVRKAGGSRDFGGKEPHQLHHLTLLKAASYALPSLAT